MTADAITVEHHGEGLTVHGLPIEVYHGGWQDAISKTGLDLVRQSPAHYFARYLDPNAPPQEPQAGQMAGALAHCAALEPLEFKRRYSIGPDVNRNTKVWKEFAAEAEALKLEPIKPDEAAAAYLQANSLHALPELAQLFAHGEAEVSHAWTDPDSGVRCRIRPDWTSPAGTDNGVILLDVKTTGRASPEAFQRTCAQKRYHVQAAFYSDGFTAATGRKVHAFVFGAVEVEYPYAAGAYMLDEQALDRGRAEYRADLATVAACRGAQAWPGYSSAIRVISLPAWAFRDGD